MNGAELRRARKRLGMTIAQLAERCRVSERCAWRWQSDGVDGPAEALIELLLHLHQGLFVGVLKPKAVRSGGLAADVRAITDKPKVRRPRSHDRRLAENATGDYERKGGEVTVLPPRKR